MDWACSIRNLANLEDSGKKETRLFLTNNDLGKFLNDDTECMINIHIHTYIANIRRNI